MSKTNYKHKTVGVSLSPVVRERANRRCRQLGMSFSRYISLCVEAEITGVATLKVSGGAPADVVCTAAVAPPTDGCLPQVRSGAGGQAQGAGGATYEMNGGPAYEALEGKAYELRGGAAYGACGDGACEVSGYAEADRAVAISPQLATADGALRALPEATFDGMATNMFAVRSTFAEAALPANEWLLEDVAGLLLRASVPFVRKPSLGGIRADLLVQHGAGTGSSGGAAALCSGVVVECRYPLAAAYTVMLGRAVMLQQMRGVRAVVLCVPYLSAFDRAMIAVFERQSIDVTTPDTLLEVLAPYLQGAGCAVGK